MACVVPCQTTAFLCSHCNAWQIETTDNESEPRKLNWTASDGE